MEINPIQKETIYKVTFTERQLLDFYNLLSLAESAGPELADILTLKDPVRRVLAPVAPPGFVL
jgi:hypothetical protein